MNSPLDTSHYEKCRKKMTLHEQYRTARFAVMAIFSIANMLFIQLGSGSVSFLFSGGKGLLATAPQALLALLLGIVLTLLVLFAREKRILLLFAVLLTITGMLLSILNLYVGIVFLVAEITLFTEFKELDLLKAQKGYPHFNERFTEQEAISAAGYQPAYDISIRTAEMPDIDDIRN